MGLSRWCVIGVALLLVLSAGCDGSEERGQCDAVAVLESPEAADQLASASAGHTPTPAELKTAALLWGIAVLAQEEGTLDPILTEAPFDELLAATPSLYPDLFASPASCTRAPSSLTQALIASSADFACTSSCVPDPALLEQTQQKLLDTAKGALLGRLKQAGKLPQYLEVVRTALAKITAARRSLEQQYKVANKVYTKGQQIVDLIAAVEQAVPDDGVTFLLSDVLEIVGAVATLAGAQSVAAVILAFRIGWEIGTAARLVIDCNAWKTSHCKDGGGGDCALYDIGCGTHPVSGMEVVGGIWPKRCGDCPTGTYVDGEDLFTEGGPYWLCTCN